MALMVVGADGAAKRGWVATVVLLAAACTVE